MWEVRPIPSKETHPLLLNVHYARRLPSISYAFGLFNGDELLGVITYGSPASAPLCVGVAGKENRHLVLELNRLCLVNNVKNMASFLVAHSLKQLPKGRIIVSYADTAQGHHGGVYRASNFYFTGTSKPRTDMAGINGGHSRHNTGDRTVRVQRSAKHRYIIFTGSKTDKRFLKNALKYPILPYPNND